MAKATELAAVGKRPIDRRASGLVDYGKVGDRTPVALGSCKMATQPSVIPHVMVKLVGRTFPVTPERNIPRHLLTVPRG